eukprot:scaffold231483_cov18-Tisochrysis_lutea.AAC.1
MQGEFDPLGEPTLPRESSLPGEPQSNRSVSCTCPGSHLMSPHPQEHLKGNLAQRVPAVAAGLDFNPPNRERLPEPEGCMSGGPGAMVGLEGAASICKATICWMRRLPCFLLKYVAGVTVVNCGTAATTAPQSSVKVGLWCQSIYFCVRQAISGARAMK